MTAVLDAGPRTRRRLVGVLFAGAALTSTGYIAAVTVAPLVAVEVLDLGPLLGVPGAVGILGTAAGSSVLARRMARAGRRSGLLIGFAVAVLGALVSVAGTIVADPVVFTAGMATLGFGNAASHQARYAAADLHPVERRGSVIGLIVWAATVGAIAGPAAVAPAGAIAEAAGRSELLGGLGFAAAAFAVAWSLLLLLLRPDPTLLALPDHADVAPAGSPTVAARTTRVPPHALVALIAMVSGHFVMVLIMSVTAIRLRQGGSGLAAVSVVLSAHILGMFALTPLVGKAVDRFGGLGVTLVGLATLVASSFLAAVAPADAPWLLTVALFLLGLGWSGGYVAGSGLLSQHGTAEERARLQGRADSYVYATSAFASLAAGALLATIGYAVLCLIGATIAGVALLSVFVRRGTVPQVRAAADR